MCLGLQSICSYFMVQEEAEKRGFDGSAAELFETMKKEKYFFTYPVAHHWEVPLTRTTVDAVKHRVTLAPDSKLASILGRTETMGASMHRYRADHVPHGLRLTGWTDDGCIEAVEGENIIGVQFHPEVDTVHHALFEALIKGKF